MDAFLQFCDHAEFRIGLACTFLTILEWMTPWADQVENCIDKMETKLHKLGDKYTQSMFYEVLVTITVPVSIFLIFTYIAEASPTFNYTFSYSIIWLCKTIVYTTCSFFGLYLVSGIIKFANDHFDGKAIGGIGIILGLIASTLGIIDKIFDH